MITLPVTRIDQSYDLTGAADTMVQNYVVLQLPSGREIRAPIGSDDVQALIRQYSDAPMEPMHATLVRRSPQPPAPAPAPMSAPMPVDEITPEPGPEQTPTQEGGITQEEAETTPIPWNELDDNILSPVMKAAFFKLKAPMLMSPRAIMALVEDISSKFTPEDWREVTGQDVIVEPPQPQPPRVRGPRWADGSPMMPGSVAGRTVPKDDMGYPIVEGEVDAGEVVGHGSDVDEDGVGQL